MEGKSYREELAAELAGRAVRELKGTEDCQTFIKQCNPEVFMISMRKWTSPYDIRSKGFAGGGGYLFGIFT